MTYETLQSYLDHAQRTNQTPTIGGLLYYASAASAPAASLRASKGSCVHQCSGAVATSREIAADCRVDKVEITTDGRSTEVKINGVPVKDIVAVRFSHRASEDAVLELEFVLGGK